MIAGNADAIFGRICEAMKQPELADNPLYATHEARGANQQQLDALIEDWTSTFSTEELEATLDSFSIPYGRIFTAPDMLSDPQYAARRLIEQYEDDVLGKEVPMAAPIPKFSRTQPQIKWTGPSLGQHTDQVIQEIAGCTPEEIAALRSQNVIS